MKNIIFIGAGGFASECYQYLLDCMGIDKTLKFKGFLSSSNDLHKYKLEHYFLGHYNDYNFKENDYCVIAIGDPKARYNIYKYLKEKNVKMYNLISPKAFITNTDNIGEANIITPFCIIAYNAVIGNCNLINVSCAIGHDCVIGDFNIIGSYSGFAGFSKIGNGNYLAPRVSIFPKAVVGDNCKISAGSVIFKRLKSNKIAFGNPAEVIGDNEIFSFN
ncbi:MAG: acetyltransferase [Helicobacteraceae bacterium]|nr:acetyltransferase [Helicobacteraceae bacterium]